VRCVQSTAAMAVLLLLALGVWAPGGTTFCGAEDPSHTAFFFWTTNPPISERLGGVSVARRSARLFLLGEAPPPRLMMWMAASHPRDSMGTKDPPLR